MSEAFKSFEGAGEYDPQEYEADRPLLSVLGKIYAFNARFIPLELHHNDTKNLSERYRETSEWYTALSNTLAEESEDTVFVESHSIAYPDIVELEMLYDHYMLSMNVMGNITYQPNTVANLPSAARQDNEWAISRLEALALIEIEYSILGL